MIALYLSLGTSGTAMAYQTSDSWRIPSTVDPPARQYVPTDYSAMASVTRVPCFRLRRHRFVPDDFIGPIRADCGVTRTWFFQKGICNRHCDEDWFQTERDVRELKDYFYRPQWRLTGDLFSDSEFFYSRRQMRRLGGALVVAAVLANTSMDENFQNWLQRQGATQPNAACGLRELGEGNYVIPATLAAYGLARMWQARRPAPNPIAESVETWSYRTSRSLLVGAPPLLTIQWLTGASRPGESSAGSDWKPFNDNNGASGHTFVGAVPFLVAAKMARRPLVKTAFFAGSGLAAYGRLCDDGHYLSQVLLGWSIAYLAVEATTCTDLEPTKYRLVPLGLNGAYGLGIEVRR